MILNAAASPGFDSERFRFAITAVGVVKALETVNERTVATPPAGTVIDEEGPVVLLCALPMFRARTRAAAAWECRRATEPGTSTVVTRVRLPVRASSVLADKRIAAKRCWM